MLEIDSEEQRDVLEIALTNLIETHVENFEYDDLSDEEAAEIRADRMADVVEAQILLHRLDHLDL